MVSELCKYASETSKTFAFNLCGEHWITTYRDRFDEIIPYTDMLFGNIAEFKVLTDNKYEEAEQLIKEVAKLPKNNTNNRIVLISMGKEGAIFDNYSFENDTHDILTVPSVELEQSLVVDT